MERKCNKNLVPIAKDLRRNMTPEEKHLWYDFLSKCTVRFKRQKVLGRYVADFYSATAKLVIEVDGAQHRSPEGKRYDEERTAFLEQYGLQIVRIPNSNLNDDFVRVCSYLNNIIETRLQKLGKSEQNQGQS